MTHVRSCLAAALALMAMSGCGAGGESPAADPSPSFAPLPHIEADSCRAAAAAFFEIPATLSPSEPMAYGEFKRKFDAMTQRIDGAMTTCTAAVEDPLREAMYQFARANALWAVCDGARCEKEIADALRQGFDKIDQSRAALDKRRG